MRASALINSSSSTGGILTSETAGAVVVATSGWVVVAIPSAGFIGGGGNTKDGVRIFGGNIFFSAIREAVGAVVAAFGAVSGNSTAGGFSARGVVVATSFVPRGISKTIFG